MKADKIKFYDIIHSNEFKDLVFDGDKKDKRLHLAETLTFFISEKEEYENVENELITTEKHGNGYTVYAWCDISGYDYWINQEQECNYIQISVAFNKQSINKSELAQLRKDIDNIYEKFEMLVYNSMDNYLDTLIGA